MSDDDFFDLDLDAARKQRAAEREGKKRDLPIRFGGEVIATLPVEMPVDVLAPLRNLDGDLTLLLREAMGCFEGAAEVYEQFGAKQRAEVIKSNLQRVQRLLTARAG